MYKVLLQVLLLFVVANASAQRYPDLSYASTIIQKVGFTTFTVNYERPSQRGRIIFGGLVPYGRPWKTGAGFHNRIAFDTDIFIDGKRVPKGEYHLVTFPDPETWTIVLTTDSLVFAKNKPYEPDKEVMRIQSKRETTLRHYEAFTIEIDIVDNNAVFVFSWDNTSVRFTALTGTNEKVMSDIRQMLRAGSSVTATEYGEAADFIAFNVRGLPTGARDTALLLISKTLTLKTEEWMEPWMLRVKADLYKHTREWDKFAEASRERIAYYRKKGTDPDEITRIEKELVLYASTPSR
jgi:hypothetical protein